MATSARSGAKEPRFAQLTLEELDPERRAIAQPLVERLGSIAGPFNLMLRSGPLTRHCLDLGNYLLYGTPLPRRLVEMAVLIRARFSTAQIEWFAHSRMAREAGLSEAIVNALKDGLRPAHMSAEEEAVFDFSVELLRDKAVSDATFERAKKQLGERAVVDLTFILGFYGMVAMALSVGEIPAPTEPQPLAPMADPFG
jgi:4-carboxymuconolactone decarboxylase